MWGVVADGRPHLAARDSPAEPAPLENSRFVPRQAPVKHPICTLNGVGARGAPAADAAIDGRHPRAHSHERRVRGRQLAEPGASQADRAQLVNMPQLSTHESPEHARDS